MKDSSEKVLKGFAWRVERLLRVRERRRGLTRREQWDTAVGDREMH